MIKLATIDDHKEIMTIFRHYKEVFPHIRNDFIKRTIESGNCIFNHGTVITFNKYKRGQNVGNCKTNKGDWILHQIATKEQGKGNATKVFNEFLDFIDGDLFLNVRADNKWAIKFYLKMGMKQVGDITWSKGTLKGKVFRKMKNNKDKELIDRINKELEFMNEMDVEEYTFFRKWLKIKKTYPIKKINPFFEDKPHQYSELDVVKNNIWVPTKPEDYLKLEPEVVPVVGKELMKIRKSLTFVSSTQANSKLGRGTRHIVIDKPTGKYLGLLDVGSDLLDLGGRDKYIGWTRESKTKGHMINHLIAGRTIMPTQPFGYNYLGGKLLALLCLSDRIINSFSEKYGDIIVAVSTTSLYGSFSQYNSLKYWKKCGHSQGSVKLLPLNDTVDLMKEWLKKKYPEKYDDWWIKTKPGGGPLKRDHKNRSMAFVYSKLGIDKDLIESNHKRGIYYSHLYTNSNDFLRGEIKETQLIPRFDNRFNVLVDLWKEKYASKRVKNLVDNKKFSYDTIFYDGLITMDWEEAKTTYYK